MSALSKAGPFSRGGEFAGGGLFSQGGPFGLSNPKTLLPTVLDFVFSGRPAAQLPMIGASIKPARGFNTAYPVTPAQQISMGQNLRLQSLRLDIFWGAVETMKGSYDFSRYDDLVNALCAAGIRPLLICGGHNTLYAADGVPRTDATGRGDFANFCLAVANRYGALTPQPMLEIWNEPNGAPDNFSYDDYAGLLNVASDFVRQYANVGIKDTIKLITGGLATGNTGVGPSGEPPFTVGMITYQRAILDRIYGARLRFDGLGWHPYVYAANSIPEDAAGANPPASAGAHSGWYGDIKSTMAEYAGYGYPNFPIYNTEQGTFLSQAAASTGPGSAQQKQQKFIARNLLAAICQGIAYFSAYNLVDDGMDYANDENAFGLYDFNFNIKPGGTAFKSVMDTLYDGSLVTYDYATAGDLRVVIAHRTGGQTKFILWTIGATLPFVKPGGVYVATLNEPGGVLVA